MKEFRFTLPFPFLVFVCIGIPLYAFDFSIIWLAPDHLNLSPSNRIPLFPILEFIIFLGQPFSELLRKVNS
jgi:hypothetical protein